MESIDFLLENVYLGNFSAWLKQLISENKYQVELETRESITRYKVSRDGETILAEIEAMQFKSNELRVRIAHIKNEIVDGQVMAFTDILLSALKETYKVSYEGKLPPSFISWAFAGTDVWKILKNKGLPPLYSNASVESKERRAWTDTGDKIERLKEIRCEAIRERGTIPGKGKACRQVPIDPKTVKKHDPELWEKWEDKDY